MKRTRVMRSGAADRVLCVWSVEAELGEAPVWVRRERALYFVDLLGRKIHRLGDDGRRQSWSTPSEVGFLFPYSDSTYLCGLRGGLYRFTPRAGAFDLLVDVEQESPAHRLNDGHMDETGRLWFGTMHEDCQSEGGALYSWRADESLRRHDDGYVITNGPVIGKSARTLYHADSGRRIVYSFDLNEAGLLSNKRPFLKFAPGEVPDGMAVDHRGNIWIAIFGGWRVECYSPAGRKIEEVAIPCAQVTKPVFAGTGLRTMYVTTARTGLTPLQRLRQPQAGGLFRIVTNPGSRSGRKR